MGTKRKIKNLQCRQWYTRAFHVLHHCHLPTKELLNHNTPGQLLHSNNFYAKSLDPNFVIFAIFIKLDIYYNTSQVSSHGSKVRHRKSRPISSWRVGGILQGTGARHSRRGWQQLRHTLWSCRHWQAYGIAKRDLVEAFLAKHQSLEGCDNMCLINKI